MTPVDFLDILKNRRSSYAFLSRVYRQEVSFALLSEMASDDNLVGKEETTSEGRKILKEFARKLRGSDLKKLEIELAAEYANLFLNVGNHLVFPYESVYTSEERLLMQEPRDQVLNEYRQEGLDKSKEFTEPEDHIAIELEFMSYLCEKTIKSMYEDDKERSLAYLKKQKDFLEKHLLVWVPDFCEDLEKATESDFYKGIATLTKNYLSFEQETIVELIDEIQG